MIEIQGKRNSATIYADKIDKETKTQIASLLRNPAYADSKIRIMPDTHSAKGTVVGTTMTLSGRVNPMLLGVDIGCGMEVICIDKTDVDYEKLDLLIHERIPHGAKIHPAPLCSAEALPLSQLHCRDGVNQSRALCSLGTLGGGNHFIELDKGENGRLYLVIHSGSRQLGHDVATYYQDQAYRYTCKKARKMQRHTVYDRRDRDEYYTKAERRAEKNIPKVNPEEAILEGELYTQYLHDIAIVTEFAEMNRRAMAQIICDAMGFSVLDRFSCVHNYIESETGLLRKGAISARQGERVIIPLNMRDGAILGIGLGNPEWNFSAPHGAGRACSRTDAKYAYSVEEYKAQMQGIFTTTAEQGSLDECPMAYKSPERILSQIGETVTVEEIIRPVYNFKSC
ncbi:MAG: RtcB family protein [Ruminococcaceae bacterium]|nr:RtcB family protein [Oscillospiraceae bacterium]